MLSFIFVLVFVAIVALFLGIFPPERLERPRLQSLNYPKEEKPIIKKKKRFSLFRVIAMVNHPLCIGPLGRRMGRDLSLAQIDITPEEMMLIKEILIAILLVLSYPFVENDLLFFWGAMGFICGYMIPELFLKKKITRIKNEIIKMLPDTIDLLALCVNAGLDFMLALKWVVEKSPHSLLIDEMNLILQEINVGKTRRSALIDFSQKYDMPDVSTFTRTLIQADRMGTSVAEALNILSEDMRVTRYRRGEQIALKAPLKMLVPLLLFIFPVVGVLVGGPIMIDFTQTNPMEQIGGGLGMR